MVCIKLLSHIPNVVECLAGGIAGNKTTNILAKEGGRLQQTYSMTYEEAKSVTKITYKSGQKNNLATRKMIHATNLVVRSK